MRDTGASPWVQARGGTGAPPWVQAGGRHPAARGAAGAARFARLDTNGDGKITKDELLAMHAKADANDDGAITRNEIESHVRSSVGAGVTGAGEASRRRGGRPSAEALFGQFDKDADGSLDADEVPPQVWRRLGTVKDDGQGSSSSSETANEAIV